VGPGRYEVDRNTRAMNIVNNMILKRKAKAKANTAD